MASPKAPQDHKTKATDEPEAFTFEHDGETYSFKPTKSVLTPGFVRKHRHSDGGDIVYTLIELLTDEDALDVLDNMSFEDNRAVIKAFDKHVEALMGADLGK